MMNDPSANLANFAHTYDPSNSANLTNPSSPVYPAKAANSSSSNIPSRLVAVLTYSPRRAIIEPFYCICRANDATYIRSKSLTQNVNLGLSMAGKGLILILIEEPNTCKA